MSTQCACERFHFEASVVNCRALQFRAINFIHILITHAWVCSLCILFLAVFTVWMMWVRVTAQMGTSHKRAHEEPSIGCGWKWKWTEEESVKQHSIWIVCTFLETIIYCYYYYGYCLPCITSNILLFTCCMRCEKISSRCTRFCGTHTQCTHTNGKSCARFLTSFVDTFVQPCNGTWYCTQFVWRRHRAEHCSRLT